MNPGRLRYQCDLLRPGPWVPTDPTKTETGEPTGDFRRDISPEAPGGYVRCDIKERDTSENRVGERLTQTREFEVTMRYTGRIQRDWRVRLHFGDEELLCTLLAIIQQPRERQTKLIAAHESGLEDDPHD